MFGKATQFLSKAIAHVTTTHRKCQWGHYEELFLSFFPLRKRTADCLERIEPEGVSEVDCVASRSNLHDLAMSQCVIFGLVQCELAVQ